MSAMQSVHTPAERTSVEILLFSLLREEVGTGSLSMEIDAPLSARDLLERLAASYPGVREILACTRMAVNQEYVDADHLVHPGDEVAFITPVSGG